MKLYKLKRNILIEYDESKYLLKDEAWDGFINDDELFKKVKHLIDSGSAEESNNQQIPDLLEPPMQNQEIWASGVTYYNSKLARQEESEKAGGGDFYARVYQAERPELFFKAGRQRTVGSGGTVRIREDSTWDVPEPELTLFITSEGNIAGYTIGNDMSSRSIEGENPLYLPQAKTYDGCASIGPCIYVTEDPLPKETVIDLEILRSGKQVFSDKTDLGELKRDPKELASFLFRECTFPDGCFLMTGTGIVPSTDFTLQKNDEIRITIDPIGTLVNKVG
jgi:2-dehydro-3-deoxy-D-arabinonate dehydratase